MAYLKINCPREDYIIKYNEEGIEKKVNMQGCSWDLNHYVINNSKTGIAQRVREEAYMVKSEVITDEEYGVDWNYFFDYSHCFRSSYDSEKQDIQKYFIKELSNAFYKIPEVISVAGIKIRNVNEEKKINAYCVIIYDNQGTDEVVDFEIIT